MGNRTRWIMSVTGGSLAALPWLGAPVFLLLICFVPLMLVEESLHREKEGIVALLPFSFAFFFFWNLLACWWIARIHFAGGISVIVLNAVLMSLVFILYSRIKRVTGSGAAIFVILWIGFEFLHHRGDLSWPWLTLGNGLGGNIKMIQWYEYTGVTGGSLWVLLVNVLLFAVIKHYVLYRVIRAQYMRILILMLAALLPPAASLYIFNSRAGEGRETTGFLILQTSLDPWEEKYSGKSNSCRLEHLLGLAEKNMDERVGYIVGPETSVDSIRITDPGDRLLGRVLGFISNYPDKGMFLGVTSFSHVMDADKSFTTRKDRDGKHFDVQNSVLFITAGNPVLTYNKYHLANGVERIPFQGIFRFLGKLSIDAGGVSGSLKRGPGPEVFRSPLEDSLVTGTLICFESAYGEYAGAMAGKGAEILMVISNDGWFRNTRSNRQHLRLSQIRAVELRRSIVRAANTGVSCHISERGEIIDRLGWREEGALYARVNRNDRLTFYARSGDYTGRSALFFSILLILNFLVRSGWSFH